MIVVPSAVSLHTFGCKMVLELDNLLFRDVRPFCDTSPLTELTHETGITRLRVSRLPKATYLCTLLAEVKETDVRDTKSLQAVRDAENVDIAFLNHLVNDLADICEQLPERLVDLLSVETSHDSAFAPMLRQKPDAGGHELLLLLVRYSQLDGCFFCGGCRVTAIEYQCH